jgi:DNA mismatch repair protein MutL
VHGTRIELRDLFYATPARLKFMKSERAETLAVIEEVKRQAMANEAVAFALETDAKRVLRLFAQAPGFEGKLRRLGDILGADFAQNALLIDQVREGVRLSGYAGLPTYSRGNAGHQYLFVNNRPVRDKLLAGALRAAYADFLARDRHPVAALFLDIDPIDLDVNVHPAKTEVRFKDPTLVRGLIIGALRHALASAGHRASTTVAQSALSGFSVPHLSPYQPLLGLNRPVLPPFTPTDDRELRFAGLAETPSQATEFEPRSHHALQNAPAPAPLPHWPLGAAVAQVHETYIVAQTEDGIVIVDQHAAHERLVYEGLKAEMAQGQVRRQALLIPEIVDLEASETQRLLTHQETLRSMGLYLEAFGPTSVLVREVPAILGQCDLAGLVRDLSDDIGENGEPLVLKDRIAELCGDYACRHSVRSGRRLRPEEMNALLRHMEATPHSGQCNHGRPTYVELKLKDIEKLFGRR